MGDAEASPGPSSSASSSPPDPTRAAKLCRRLHRGLAVRVGTSLPASAQHKAALQLLELRDLVANGTALDVACKTQLLCVGIACARAAWYSGGDEAAQQMRLTMTLVFALLVLAEATATAYEDADADADPGATGLVEAWRAASLADNLFAASGVYASSMAQRVAVYFEMCHATLRVARQAGDDGGLEQYATLAEIFYRCGIARATHAEVGGTAPFVALHAVGAPHADPTQRKESLMSLVEVAESEAGQQAMRDLILSVKLPRSVVGVRRTLLLTREANAAAAKQHAEKLTEAHDAAMRGASWCWQHDADLVHRLCAPLAGLAVILCPHKSDMRKADAFNGRVQLPFLQCTSPPADVPCLTLLQHTREWVLYTLDARGKTRVHFRDSGFDAACTGLLMLTQRVGK